MPKKKVKPGIVEPDPLSLSLLVHYVEVVTDDNGRVSSTNKTKQVKINSLDPETDIGVLTKKVIDDCKYIPSSRFGQVEQALLSLQSRELSAPSRSGRQKKTSRKADDEMSAAANKQPASMNKIEEYLELMYEEGEGKVVGTANVLELSATVENLELLIQNQSLMALLSRLLDTEYKANIEMCYNIIRTFAAFSNFLEMHPLLATYKAGALTMKVLSHETSRVSLRERDLSQLNDEEKRIQTGAIDNGTDRETTLRHFRAKKTKAVAKSAKLKKWSEKVMTACYSLLTNLAEDLSVERKMLKRGLLDSLVSHLSTTSSVRLLITIVALIWKLSNMRENVTRLFEVRVEATLSKFLPATATLNGETFPADELTVLVIKVPPLQPPLVLFYN